MNIELENSTMLTTTEVADLLHVHPNTVRQWSNNGLLRVFRLGPRGDRRHKLDGASIEALLRQTGRYKRDAIFWHYPHSHHSTPGGAIRQGDWKLIEYFEDGRAELYNLKDDIGESRNLAEQERKKTSQLQRKLAAWRKSAGAKMPTPNADYDPAKAGQWGSRQRR